MNHVQNSPAIPSVSVSNHQAVTTSKAVAEFFGKRHDNVLRAIETLKSDCPEYHALNFEDMIETVAVGKGAIRQTPIVQMTKDGFTLLTMGFTGKQAMQFKIAYINRFNELEAALRNPLALTDGQHLVVAKDGVVIYHKQISDRTAKRYLSPAPTAIKALPQPTRPSPLISAAQARELDERLDRLMEMFHPYSQPFRDLLGIRRTLYGRCPESGVLNMSYVEVLPMRPRPPL